jgi:hypothetical protein
MAGHMRIWARRNAQRVHNRRETIFTPSSQHENPMNSNNLFAKLLDKIPLVYYNEERSGFKWENTPFERETVTKFKK